MNVAVRVDGNINIGAGHVFRCITLAEKLLEYNINCTFFARNITKYLIDVITKKFKIVLLDKIDISFAHINQYSEWLGVNEEFDAIEFISKANNLKFEAIIVDHYAISWIWEKIVINKFQKIMVIDDLANRKHYSNLLIDQSIGRKANCYSGLVPSTCSVLAGTKFALIDQEFDINKKRIVKRFELLINFGGVDKENYTMHVLNILSHSKIANINSIKILIGKDYPFKSKLIDLIKKINYRVVLVEAPSNVAQEVAECKFAIGAGGTSLLERSVLSLPSIIYATAENQLHICKEYIKQNLGFLIHRDEKYEKSKLVSAICKLLLEDQFLKKSEANRKFIDIKGVDRVSIQFMKKFNFLQSYSAKLNDAEFIFKSRYIKTDSSFYINDKVPSYTNHKEWFKNALKNKNVKHIIFQAGSVKYGYVRLDFGKEFTKLNIYIYNKYRGRGFSSYILNDVCNRYNNSKLRAIVHPKNLASLNAFLKAGFRKIKKNEQFLEFEKC